MELRRQRTRPVEIKVGRTRRLPAPKIEIENWNTEFVESLPLRRCVAYYLMFSYLYYVHDIGAVNDSYYDQLCFRLDKGWRSINHPHKRLLCRASLQAGTGYDIRPIDYPLIVQSAAWTWLKHNKLALYEAHNVGGRKTQKVRSGR